MQIVIHRSINLAFSISLHAVWSINPERACACELAIPRSYLLRDNCQNLWPVATTQSPNPETSLSDDLSIDKAAPATPPLITDRVQTPTFRPIRSRDRTGNQILSCSDHAHGQHPPPLVNSWHIASSRGTCTLRVEEGWR